MAKQKKGKESKSPNLHGIYKEYVLEKEGRPKSAYHLSRHAGIEENKIYDTYGSVEAIEVEIMKGYVQDTLADLKSDKNYPQFSVREKLLGFFFTLTSKLKAERSFLKVLAQCPGGKSLKSLKEVKRIYKSFTYELIAQGYESGEVEDRPLVAKAYPEMFWACYGYIMGFWFKDNSAGFERTDAAIEKSVNLLFDALSKGFVDGLFDFGRFHMQEAQL